MGHTSEDSNVKLNKSYSRNIR